MDGVCHLEQGPLRQPWTGAPRVVQKAVYDVDIKHVFGVLGHQRMGLARWPLWAWMQFAIWSRGTPGLVRLSVVQKAVYDVDIKFGLGVLGHQGMGLARWALAQGMDGVCHLEQGPGAPHDLCAKVWCKTPFMIWTSNLVLGS